MEGDPFAVIEAMTIAGYATGCERGYIYLRGEYPLAAATGSSQRSRRRARAASWATTSCGRGLRVRHRAAPGRRRLHLRRGDRDLQLDRGLSRRAAQQAAVPGRRGLFGQPTVVNNVETLSTCSTIVARGRRGVRRDRHRELDRAQAVLRVGLRRPARRLRGAVRHDAARAARAGRRRRRRPAAAAVLLGGAAGDVRDARRARSPADLRGRARARRHPRLGRRARARRHGRPRRACSCAIAAFFRDESCGQCVPCRVGTVRQEELLARLLSGRTRGTVRRRAGAARRDRAGDARRLDLRSRPDRVGGDRVRDGELELGALRDDGSASPRRSSRSTSSDGRACPRARRSSTPARSSGIDTPTLCYGETLTPENACRVCVVEVEGARVLVPACSRKVEAGMVVHTDTERVRLSRRMVLEFLASSVDLSTAPGRASATSERYERQARALRPAGAAGRRRATARAPVTTRSPTARPPRRSQQPVKVDNDLYVRDYAQVHPVLQVRRRLRRAVAEHVRDRRRRPRLRRPHLDRVRRPLPDRPASTAATASRSARPAR